MYEEFFARSVNLDSYLKKKFSFNHEDTSDKIKITPESKQCLVCKQKLEIIKSQDNGFMLMSVIAVCEVFIGKCCNETCTNFEQTTSYSGASSGIINYSNKFFIAVELILEYMTLYSKNGVAFSTWCETKFGNPHQEISFYKNVPVSSYYGVLHEVFCRSTDLFMFPEKTFYCCASPKIIQMDGLVNSVKANRLITFSEPWIIKNMTKRASKMSDRQIEKLSIETSQLILEIIQIKKM